MFPLATAAAAAEFAPVRPSGRRAAHHATPAARKDVPERRGLSGHAICTGRSHPGRVRAALQTLGSSGDSENAPVSATTARANSASTRRNTPMLPGRRLARRRAVLEAFVDFEREVSVVAARGLDGSFVHYGVIENDHTQPHSRRFRRARARSAPRSLRTPQKSPGRCSSKLEVVGVLCVEFFVTRGRRAADQRTCTAASQFGTPDVRCLRHQPVRAAVARRLRVAAGIDRAAASRGDGQSAGRSLGRRRAELGGSLRFSAA